MTTTDFIATLALAIAAATFALQIKQWFDSGPKIHLSLIADAMEIPRGDGLPKLALTATNRGSERTQITHMVAYGYSNWWKRFRHRPNFSAIVSSTTVPSFLEAKGYWIGMANYSPETTTLRNNRELYVSVVMTHRERHYLIRVPLPRKKIVPTKTA